MSKIEKWSALSVPRAREVADISATLLATPLTILSLWVDTMVYPTPVWGGIPIMHIFLQFRADSVVGAARVLRRTSVVMKRPNIPTIVYHNTVLVPLWNIRYICTCLKTLEELYHLIQGFQYPVFYHIFRIFLPAFRFINGYRCLECRFYCSLIPT